MILSIVNNLFCKQQEQSQVSHCGTIPDEMCEMHLVFRNFLFFTFKTSNFTCEKASRVQTVLNQVLHNNSGYDLVSSES